jgi:hypothetical protein
VRALPIKIHSLGLSYLYRWRVEGFIHHPDLIRFWTMAVAEGSLAAARRGALNLDCAGPQAPPFEFGLQQPIAHR